MARNDTQVVPYKVFAFYANTSINRNLKVQAGEKRTTEGNLRGLMYYFFFLNALATRPTAPRAVKP